MGLCLVSCRGAISTNRDVLDERELTFKERMQALEKGTRESNERQEYLVFHANRCTGRKWTYDIT